MSTRQLDPAEVGATARTLWRPPRWAAPVSLFLCVAGIAVASYLTYAHYTDPRNLACSDSGVINCARVTTSAQSRFLGMPVAVLGLAFFVGMTVLCLPQLWRRQEWAVRAARVAGVVVGIAMILYLIAAELFVIEAICLWCSIVHGLAFLLFVAVVAATVTGSSRPDDALDDEDLYDDDELEDDAYQGSRLQGNGLRGKGA